MLSVLILCFEHLSIGGKQNLLLVVLMLGGVQVSQRTDSEVMEEYVSQFAIGSTQASLFVVTSFEPEHVLHSRFAEAWVEASYAVQSAMTARHFRLSSVFR